ncbi:MAG: hypothetical protein GY862_04145, partial [Gammaproteobacteria bacterium]|nr:hypothetical protein [Gammaproteobacteria bacterium]
SAQEALAAAKERAAVLQNTLAAANAKWASLEAKLTKKDQTVKSAQEALAVAKERAAVLRNTLAAANAKLASLEAKLTKKDQTVKSAQEALAAAKAKSSALESAQAEAKKQAIALQNALAAMNTNSASLEAKLIEKDQALKSAEKALVTAKAESASLETRLIEKNLALEAAQKVTAEAKTKAAALLETQSKIANLQSARKAAATANRNLLKAYAEKSKKGSKAAAKLEQARQDLHAAQALVAKLSGAKTLHTIQAAESLSRISRKHYGTLERWPEIFEANKHILESPEKISQGLVLVIP